MRQQRTVQATIFEIFAGHEIGCELKAISQWLDRQSTLASLVAGDLRRHGLRETGRRGLPAETVLRCALLKQQRPGRRSIGRCWPAPNRTSWKAAPRCGSTARSPRR
jgi:IS5 family transposase